MTEQQLTERLRADARVHQRPAPEHLHAGTMAKIRADVFSVPHRRFNAEHGSRPHWVARSSLLAAMLAVFVCMAASIATAPGTGADLADRTGDLASAASGAAAPVPAGADGQAIADTRRALAAELRERFTEMAGDGIRQEMQAIARDFTSAFDRLAARAPGVLRDRLQRRAGQSDV